MYSDIALTLIGHTRCKCRRQHGDRSEDGMRFHGLKSTRIEESHCTRSTLLCPSSFPLPLTKSRKHSETQILIRDRFLHTALIDLPHRYGRAQSSSRRPLIFVHPIAFVLYRRHFSTLQPRTLTEARAEHFVARSNLAEEFRDVGLLRGGVGRGRVNSWELGN